MHEGFLTEEALDAALADAAVVLIPYSHFFQSGIAVRAVELGVPVAGPRHPFLADLLGGDWPGLVAGDDAASWTGAAVAGGGRRARASAAAAGAVRGGLGRAPALTVVSAPTGGTRHTWASPSPGSLVDLSSRPGSMCVMNLRAEGATPRRPNGP